MCNFTRVGIILDQRCLWQISRLSPIWKSEWREAITLAGSNCRISSLHKSAIFAANMEPCKTGHKMAWNDRNIFKLGILQPVEAAAVRVGVFRAWKGGLKGCQHPHCSVTLSKAPVGHVWKWTQMQQIQSTNPWKALLVPPNLPQVPCPWLKRFGFAAHQLSWWVRV